MNRSLSPSLVGLLVLASLAAFAMDVPAATISHTHTEVVLPVGSIGSFMVPQYFDPGGMPLIKVTLEVFAASSGGSNTFDNEDPAGGMATVAIGTDVKVSGPIPGGGSPLIVHAIPVNTNSGPVAGDSDGAPNFIGADSISVAGTGSTDLKSASKMAALDIAPYQGAGMVTIDYSTLTSTAGSFTTTGGGANSVEFGTIRADFRASVTYEFVPEPSGFVLAAVGGMALYCVRRRRR